MNYLVLLFVGILTTIILISSNSYAQNESNSNRDVYIFVQTFVRNSDGQLDDLQPYL